jgi:hypothetical protein
MKGPSANGTELQDLDIFCYYDRQRFTQYGSQDCANWYGIEVPTGKKKYALYPAMGRAHVNALGQNRLIFNAEPVAVFKSINYFYVVDGTTVYQYDKFYNQVTLPISVTLGEAIWAAYLPVDNLVYVMMTDGHNTFLITEGGMTTTAVVVTDPNRPPNPRYIATFGDRFVVSTDKTPNYRLSTVNVAGGASACFSFGVAPNQFALFNRATGVIGQFAVLQNQLYILCDYTTDVWANITSSLTVANATRTFPWKKNSSYNFNFGINDPNSLAVNFGMMVWLAQNEDGLVTFMMSDGQLPKPISSQAINVLLQDSAHSSSMSPFLFTTVDGFLYQYENTIFYRANAGVYAGLADLDVEQNANSIEYNFATQTWARTIELDGDRNRIEKHVYFNNTHLVTVQGDRAMYQMAGNIYYNELLNPAQLDTQAPDAFLKYPMRYELTTKQIYSPEDYAEFLDEYVEIDFVFGDQTFYKSTAPFNNTVYIVGETSTPDVPVYIVSEDGALLIQEGTNTPQFDDTHYYTLFKPYIELYYSDDGGITFTQADVREFSPLGAYRWRMRWYELGCSRNRCYKLVAVSSAPIVVLGAVRATRRVSGGAN